jgi:hypothetical protein
MKFDKLIETYEKQLEFDFEYPSKEETKEKEETPAKSSPKDESLSDLNPRTFTVFWDRNTYETTAVSKQEAISHIAARLSKGSTTPVGVLKNRMENSLVRDEKWNVKY